MKILKIIKILLIISTISYAQHYGWDRKNFHVPDSLVAQFGVYSGVGVFDQLYVKDFLNVHDGSGHNLNIDIDGSGESVLTATDNLYLQGDNVYLDPDPGSVITTLSSADGTDAFQVWSSTPALMFSAYSDGDVDIIKDLDVDGAITSIGHIQGGTGGFGIARTEGTAHIQTASAGAVTASTTADDLVVENSASGGISILVPNTGTSSLMFGNVITNDRAKISYSGLGNTFNIGTSIAGASTILRSGAFVTTLTLDASQNATFTGTIGSGAISSTGNVSGNQGLFSGLVSTGSAYWVGVNAGLSATYSFGGGGTGDIATMTFTGGILTAVTTVP